MPSKFLFYLAATIAAIVGSATMTNGAAASARAAAAAPIAAAIAAAVPADYEEFATPAEGAASFSLDDSSRSSSSSSDTASNVGNKLSSIPLPSAVKVTPCNVNEPTRDECIKGLFYQILPNLKYDLPEYNMQSIDPFFYRSGIFRYANEGIQGGLRIKNMYIHGLSTMKVHNVISNFTKSGFIIKLSIDLPKLRANGQFKADVKFGGLRLVPKGPFNITIDNIRATILTDGVIEDTEAGRRIRLQRLNANLSIGEAHITANGIFTDRNLNAMILNLVNENLPEIIRVGIPATRDQWAPVLVTHVNEFFSNVPINKFLVQ